MFNKAKITLSVLLLLLSAAALAVAQSYSVPKKLPLERTTRRTFPEYFGRGRLYPALIPETFFPVGWSKDGKFAYYYEPVDDACGCYFAHLVIQDMRTDKVLWEFKYNQDDDRDPNTGDMKGEGDIRKLWQKNQKLFSDKLREHAIIAGTSVLLGKTFSAGRSFTAKAVKTMGKDEYYDQLVKKLAFVLTSKGIGTKTLYIADYSKEEYSGMLDAGVVGVIKSPYENRIAVIGMEVNRGWEGPPHTGDVRIVGADLISGFGK